MKAAWRTEASPWRAKSFSESTTRRCHQPRGILLRSIRFVTVHFSVRSCTQATLNTSSSGDSTNTHYTGPTGTQAAPAHHKAHFHYCRRIEALCRYYRPQRHRSQPKKRHRAHRACVSADPPTGCSAGVHLPSAEATHAESSFSEDFEKGAFLGPVVAGGRCCLAEA